MLREEIKTVKVLARVIAKEEIAGVGAKSESKIKDLEAKVDKLADMLVKDIKDLANEIKNLEAKIKSPVAVKSIFDKKGGK